MTAGNGNRKGLGDIVEAIRLDSEEGEILHLLALTYEFAPEQLASFLFSSPHSDSREHWKPGFAEMARIRPVVFYDAAKSRETSALPPLLELHPWQSRAFGCHHSKAYLLVTEHSVHLVLGSCNLTRQGLAHNREVIGHFCWPARGDMDPSDPGLLDGFIRFLATCLGQHVHESTESALWNIIACLKRRQEELAREEDLRDSLQGQRQVQPQALVWSGYGRGGGKSAQNGLERLRTLWDAWHPGREPDTLFAVSPFFDQDTDKPLARQVLDTFTSLKRIVLVSSKSVITTGENIRPTLSKEHFDGFDARELYVIPLEAGKDERELVKAEAKAEGIRMDESEKLDRPLHAKVLMLASGDDGLVYAGSANFSRNAWTGRNQELGFAYRTASAGKVWEEVLTGLYVEAGRDRFQELPERPLATVSRDAEEEVASDWYPGFIDYLSLELEENGKDACFVLHPLQDHDTGWCDLLQDYRVSWGGGPSGEGEKICFSANGHSQSIKDGTWQTLLLQGRSLAFIHVASGDCYWVPYVYSDALVDRGESLLSLSSLDWLALYGFSNPSAWDAGRGDASPDSAGRTETEGTFLQDDGPDRTQNPVIAMQIWLKSFGMAEGQLEWRLDVIFEEGWNMADRIGHRVAGFLRTLAKLVDSECRRDASGIEIWVFKTGETLQLARRLVRKCQGHPAEQALLAAVAQELRDKLCRGIKDKALRQGTVLAQYLAFLGIKPGEDRGARP